MTVHLVKLCVGTDSIEDLAHWQAGRLDELKAAGEPPDVYHQTFQTPRRRDELLDGGSLYWVIKGVIQVRQRIRDLQEAQRNDGSSCCRIILERELIPVRPVPRRPFQGWRYLDPADAPADLANGSRDGIAELPPAMRKELAELGLI